MGKLTEIDNHDTHLVNPQANTFTREYHKDLQEHTDDNGRIVDVKNHNKPEDNEFARNMLKIQF
jgi:hypothetical protein